MSTTPAPRRRFAWQQSVLGELVAEFLGTFVLICFGTGVVAVSVAALNQSGRGKVAFEASGDWLLISFGWGFAVMFGAWVAGGVSGAHLNPAVTLAQALRRGFPWRKVPTYWAAQVLGALAGAALVYANYHTAIAALEHAMKIDRGSTASAATVSIFTTTPASYFGGWTGPLLDQVIGTGLLVLVIFALTDERNQPVRANVAPLAIGFLVVAIGMSFGPNAGYAINPARDFGPRLLAWFAGWGKVALPGNYGNVNGYLWIPIVGPLLGGAIGAYVYDFLILDVLKARGEPEQDDVEERDATTVDHS